MFYIQGEFYMICDNIRPYVDHDAPLNGAGMVQERFKALNRADFERRIDNSGAFWKRPSPFNSPMTIDMRRNRWESNRVFGEKGSKL